MSRGLPACTPGLRDLSQAVLREDMPARGQGRHDSKEDAAVSMRLVMHELEQQHRTSPMAPPDIKVREWVRMRLCGLCVCVYVCVLSVWSALVVCVQTCM